MLDAVKEATGGKGVAAVYDGVGASTWEASLDALRVRGTYVPYGNASGAIPPMNPLILNNKGSLFMTRPKLNDHLLDRAEFDWRWGELIRWVQSGQLEVT